eukprot:8472470-Alexandrium_andersonii.AAC.1
MCIRDSVRAARGRNAAAPKAGGRQTAMGGRPNDAQRESGKPRRREAATHSPLPTAGGSGGE